MAALILHHPARARVDAVIGGGGVDYTKHIDRQTEEVISRKDGGAGSRPYAYWAGPLRRPRKDSVQDAL